MTIDRLANPAVFAVTTLGIEPHPGQLAYLIDQHPTKALVGGRRSGKTIALAIEILYYAARAVRDRRSFRQLLVAPAVDQARLLFAAVSRLLVASPLGGLVESEVQSPFPELRLVGGGLIFVRAGHDGGRLLRGHSAHRVVVDEAAYMADNVVTEAVMPILADSGGQLVLGSTPTSKGSLFHGLYERGRTGTDDRVRSFTIRSDENPHIDREYVEAQRRELTEAQYRQEYAGEFVDQTDSVFRWDHVIACATGQEGPAISGHRYVVGWDPALRRDRSAIVVLDVTAKPWQLVRLDDLKGSDYILQVRRVAETARAFNSARVVIDQTCNEVLAELLRREGSWVEPFTFTNKSKSDLIMALVAIVERHEIVIPHRRDLLDELRFYSAEVLRSGRIRYGAPEGGRVHDDLVTAIALAVRGAGGGPHPESFAELGFVPFLTTSSPSPRLGSAITPDQLWQHLDLDPWL